jgi:hypothetical protein
MVAVPGKMPYTTPAVRETDAIVLLELLHVPPLIALLKVVVLP